MIPENEVNVTRYNLEDGIVAQMDCGGSNVAKINEQIPGIVKMIITSRINHPEVKARQRAKELDVPLAEFDFAEYEKSRCVSKGDVWKAIGFLSEKTGKRHKDDLKAAIKILKVREDACRYLEDKMLEKMGKEGIKTNIPHFGAGFMSLLPDYFVERYFILTIHPGDLTKYNIKGLKKADRRVTGDAWVPSAKAIAAGDEMLYSTMFLTKPGIDTGTAFMRGYGLEVDQNYLKSHFDLSDKKTLQRIGGAAQDTLKYIGDHVIAGATFMDLFRCNWGWHNSGTLAYRSKECWNLVPNGIKIEDHVLNNPETPFQRDEGFLMNKKEMYQDKLADIVRFE